MSATTHSKDVKYPANWISIQFGEIFELSYGKSLTKKNRNPSGGKFPVYGSNGVVDYHSKYLVDGPVIIVGRKGAAGAVSFSSENCWPIDTTYFVKPSTYLDIRFCYYVIKSLRLAQFEKSTAVPGLSRDDAYDLVVNIPPFKEQKRIVAKTEDLFSELDNGIEILRTAREQLKVYHQAILKHAFEGKLTAQWRAHNEGQIESAECLLARIKEEREGHSTRLSTRRTRKCFTDFSSDEQERLPQLPFGWVWAQLGSLFEVVSGATPKGVEQVKGASIPYYKVSDMNTPGNETKMSVAALYLSEEERDDLRLTTYPEGTVIFPKRGGAILTNKKRMLSRPSCFDLNTMGVINTLRSISTNYLWHWFQKLDLSRIYDGSNVPQINNKNVEPLPFPLCSLAEQKEIVEILEEKLSVVGQLRLDIELELEKAEALRHSILKKAFSGKLVAQDPNDEPASILLERIKAEKAETENGKMKIKRTAAA